MTNKKELLKFFVGGSSAVITDFVTYKLLVDASFSVNLSKLIAFIAGSIVGFIINKFWTFESKGKLGSEIFRYALLYMCSATLNVIVNKAALSILDFKLFGFLCATGASTITNFVGQKFFVFNRR